MPKPEMPPDATNILVDYMQMSLYSIYYILYILLYYSGIVSRYCIYTRSVGNVSIQSQYKEKSQSPPGTTRQPQSIFGKRSR